MNWTVLFDEDFAGWLDDLDEGVRRVLLGHLVLLRERGPSLGRPHVDTLKGSNLPNLKELRFQFRGDPWRLLFAFDPNRAAILLVGGNKGGDRRWYKTQIKIAEERFERHLRLLEEDDHGNSV